MLHIPPPNSRSTAQPPFKGAAILMNGVPVARYGLIGVRGFPARGYFIPGRDGTGTWHISRVVHVSARAPFCRFREFP